ncbi:MAG: diguanylate cyclase [Candidatus Berkiellales bacterium]
MKVLVCDDSLTNRQLLGGYLQKMGHQPIFAENGIQAIEQFIEHQPELVLMDVDMPEMDGYQATRALRQSCTHFSQWTPVIFVSSYVDDKSIVKGIESGGDDYLTKPVSPVVLRAKIHAMRRLVAMRENLIDFGNQLREVNEKLLASNEILSELSLKDPLTRLGNRRAFEENLQKISRMAQREGKSISLLMVDIDHFKKLNDTYGHQSGDQCLQQIAQVLRQGAHRAGDFVARFGGEEFAMILSDTSLSGAMYVADRLRMGVEALQLPNKNAPLGHLTISIGVASAIASKSFVVDQLVCAADAGLYNAKETGRNCIIGANVEVTQNTGKAFLNFKTQRHFPPSSSSTTNTKH